MPSRFPTTRWTLVHEAGDVDEERARAALAELCERYWTPLHAHARHRHRRPEDALDAVQGFLTSFLSAGSVARARRERGRFRSYLLRSFENWMANEADRANTQRRGSGRPPLSLDQARAEEQLAFEPAACETPASAFERQWALTLLERALVRLRSEARTDAQRERLEILLPFLEGPGAGDSYRRAGETLDMSEGAVKVAMHRLRRRFREILRSEVAETVPEAADIDDELRALLGCLGRA